MAKSHRATLIRILTEIAADAENKTAQRILAIKLAMALKGKAGRAALDRVDSDIARLIGEVKSG